LTTTQTQQVSNQSSSIVKCSPGIVIDQIKIPSSGTGVVNVTFSNVGQQNVTNTVVDILFNNGTAVSSTNGPTLLTPGQGAQNTTAGILSGSVSSVRVRGTCGNQPVTATCDSSKPCWQTG